MKNVLITGGSRGIGKACVYEFSNNGYRVFLNYNKSSDEAEKIKNETGAVIVKADVSDSKQVNDMAEFIHTNYGKIDVIVNNAGISLHEKGFLDVNPDQFDSQFNTNLKGAFFLTQCFINKCKEKKSKELRIFFSYHLKLVLLLMNVHTG